MFIFDAHCDTLSTGKNIWENNGHFDLARAIHRGAGVQVMAAFGQGKEGQLARMKLASESLPSNFVIVGAIEGADEIGEIDDLIYYQKLGVQILGLTWNNNNRLAGGCGENNKALTPLGKQVIEYCQHMNIIIDLAHASEKTFWETFTIINKPVIVSHTCCDNLNEHKRNLNDLQLKTVAQFGGVVGITFYPPFLTGSDKADITDVVKHIQHAVNVAGTESVGIGSDFDGCDILPDGLSGVQDIPKLVDMLPYSDDVKEKIAGRNFLRLVV